MFNIEFQPIGRRGEFGGELSLLECARQLRVDLVSICGGDGSCGRCRVQVVEGRVSKLTLEEDAELTAHEVLQGYRLACMTYPLSDVTLHVPPDSLSAPQRTQVEGLEVPVPPEPVVRGYLVTLVPPTLTEPLADDQNLWAALKDQHRLESGNIDFGVQQALSEELRQRGWTLQVAVRQEGDAPAEIIALGEAGRRWLGLAVDIGTTKVAGYLLDLESGRTLASKGVMNPQISYGEDVISRIVAAGKSQENAARLQWLLVEAVDGLATELCAEAGAQRDQIADAVVVCNTAIHHLFLRLPVSQLGLSPYVPAVRAAVDVKARDLGLNLATGACVHLLPNIAGYVGADHVALLLATRLGEAQGTVLALDIGTNTEICLNHRGKLTSVSCASGPAFEGAHIKFGMRAAPGAIEHVRIDGERIEIQTIAGEPPVGICGSGLLDIVAQLRLKGVIDRSGRMREDPRVRKEDGVAEYVLAERDGLGPITLSQKDVRELQLAKAAIRLGIQALVMAEGLEEADIERVIIAGAFGTFIDVNSAITIGMLPDLPRERFEQVGNAAGTGARLALVSANQRELAAQLALRDGYIELASVPDFHRQFARATYL